MIANLSFAKYLKGRHVLPSMRGLFESVYGTPIQFPWETTVKKHMDIQPQKRDFLPSWSMLSMSFLPNVLAETTSTTQPPDLSYAILQTNNFKRHKQKFKKNKRKTRRKKLRNLSIAKKEKLNY
mmetsp:Transcript_73904/g.85801  ORF Transcript_73904/g.85801 Transcript_73904/m.85801 type:complete len:124 (-) Transcript_73904:169-540(-)